eukprot:3768189-Rhodomonas_salina.3
MPCEYKCGPRLSFSGSFHDGNAPAFNIRGIRNSSDSSQSELQYSLISVSSSEKRTRFGEGRLQLKTRFKAEMGFKNEEKRLGDATMHGLRVVFMMERGVRSLMASRHSQTATWEGPLCHGKAKSSLSAASGANDRNSTNGMSPDRHNSSTGVT